MALFDCFGCDAGFRTTDGFEEHLWSVHLSQKRTESGLCPSCDIPLTQQNATHHLSCVFDTDPAELGLFHDINKQVCLFCGEPYEDGRFTKHLLSHSIVEWGEKLGDSHDCEVCGNPLADIDNHVSCLRKAATHSTEGDSGFVECPHTDCEITRESRGLLLWHIWDEHLGADRTCPGCNERIQIGTFRHHLVCIKELGPQISNLLPSPGKTCFICGLEVYDSSVLHRHFFKKHLPQSVYCPHCDEEFTAEESADVVEHLGCVARFAGETPLEPLNPIWPCPVCGEEHDSRGKYCSHLETKHLDLLRTEDACNQCGKSVTDRTDHLDCLLADRDSRDSRRDETRFEPKSTVSDDEYFGELHEFVDREMDAEREEHRRQYKESSINQMARQEEAIPELIYLGERYHPDFDTQLTFQRPDAESESKRNRSSLPDQFGIYPRDIVLVGSEGQDDHLPVEGTVSFVDDQTIGIAFPSLDGNLNTPPIRNLTNDDRTYHVAKLLNPRPFETEHKAINDVRSDSQLHDIVTGKTELVGSALRLPDEATGELNEYQAHAVERALGTEEVLCIHGPPGTGKTRTLTRLIRLAVARGDRVLATSHSNQAIDNLLVGTSTEIQPDPSSLHYVGSPAGRERFLPQELRDAVESEGPSKQQRAKRYLNRPEECSITRIGPNTTNSVVETQYAGRSVVEADVVASTMGSLENTSTDLGEFDLVIVDEAGQAAQPPTFIPAVHGEKLVLSGDHLQLPPYVADENSKEEQMHISLFEHLLTLYGDNLSKFLRRQYRMNEQIAAFPNKHIYDGRIETDEQNREWKVDDLDPVLAVNVIGEEESPPGSRSTRNPREAELVAKHVKLLTLSGLNPGEIGVITPYTAQISEIRSAVHNELEQSRELKIDTVDSFQGSEREAIIVSWVRSNKQNNSGFLSFPEEGKRRLNVALTRARKRLVLIGDWNTLGSVAHREDPDETGSHLFASLYQMLNEQNAVKHVN